MTDSPSHEKVAILGDIHGNIAALEAAYADMDERGVGPNRYCLGDLVGYGAFPNEVVEFVQLRAVPSIFGNYDQGVGQASDDCGCAYQTEKERRRGDRSIAWTNDDITKDNRAYLRDLDGQIELGLGDRRVVLVHGSPAASTSTSTRTAQIRASIGCSTYLRPRCSSADIRTSRPSRSSSPGRVRHRGDGRGHRAVRPSERLRRYAPDRKWVIKGCPFRDRLGRRQRWWF